MGRAAAGKGARCEAAARRCAHAVRLADHRPNRANQSGCGRARAKACCENGSTPVLDAGEWRKLIDSIPTGAKRDLRDRALIATLTYSFARIGAALKMKVEDLRPKSAGWQIQLHEKGGKRHAMPCHHALAEALRATSMPPASPMTGRDFSSAPARGTKRW
jgi:integrase